MNSTTTQHSFRTLKEGDLPTFAKSSGGCVSILLPTHRHGRETQQDPIRLKNLLADASSKLREIGGNESVLAPVEALLDDPEFWRHQGHGLAIFATAEDCRFIRLNTRVEESVHVGDSFLLSPLVREHNSKGRHFIVALSWDKAILFRSDGETLTEVETDRLPAAFDELVLPRDPEESLQNTSHRSIGNTGGSSTAMFHGQGEGEQKIEADRVQYLSIVADEVAGAIYNSGMPVVLVATTDVAGHFSTASPFGIDATVDGSPTAMSTDEIRQAAHTAIAPQMKADHEKLIERFGTAMANSQATTDMDEILEAAKNGKIDSLIVCDASCDHVNEAVVGTLRNGGDVVRCDPDELPSKDSKAAAIFRY